MSEAADSAIGPDPARSTGPQRDITKRKRAEEALGEQERFVRQIAELLPVVVAVVDLTTGRHSYISRDVVGLHGYSLDEIARMKDPSFELLQRFRGSVVRCFESVLNLGVDFDISWNGVRYCVRRRERVSWIGALLILDEVLCRDFSSRVIDGWVFHFGLLESKFEGDTRASTVPAWCM